MSSRTDERHLNASSFEGQMRGSGPPNVPVPPVSFRYPLDNEV